MAENVECVATGKSVTDPIAYAPPPAMARPVDPMDVAKAAEPVGQTKPVQKAEYANASPVAWESNAETTGVGKAVDPAAMI